MTWNWHEHDSWPLCRIACSLYPIAFSLYHIISYIKMVVVPLSFPTCLWIDLIFSFIRIQLWVMSWFDTNCFCELKYMKLCCTIRFKFSFTMTSFDTISMMRLSIGQLYLFYSVWVLETQRWTVKMQWWNSRGIVAVIRS